MTFVQRDKTVQPDHVYSHAEGEDGHQKFYYQDSRGNFVRYTNAPSGHADAASYHGDPAPHSADPTFDTAPQYFTPDGRKLTRAPYDGAPVEWNQSYHPDDPKNAWMGRWVNPESGDHEYTYLDADVRMNPRMYMHHQVMLTDAALPRLRQYVMDLYNSPNVKDQITAVALALIDQGHFSPDALTMISAAEVKQVGPLVQFGKRWIYADHKLQSAVSAMLSLHHPDSPFFAVPVMTKKGEPEEGLIRRMGPHYLICLLDQLGVHAHALHVYQATQTLSREVQRLLTTHEIPFLSALHQALLVVAEEMGHDLSMESDQFAGVKLILDLLIDPIALETLQANAAAMKLGGDQFINLPPPPPSVLSVSMDLTTLTNDEESFSRWLHLTPLHQVERAA
jgi:hypothetical protein